MNTKGWGLYHGDKNLQKVQSIAVLDDGSYELEVWNYKAKIFETIHMSKQEGAEAIAGWVRYLNANAVYTANLIDSIQEDLRVEQNNLTMIGIRADTLTDMIGKI